MQALANFITEFTFPDPNQETEYWTVCSNGLSVIGVGGVGVIMTSLSMEFNSNYQQQTMRQSMKQFLRAEGLQEPFSTIKSLTCYIFKTQKSHGKNLIFTWKKWIKRKFFTKHPKSILFDWDFFSPNPLNLRLLITCLLTVIDLTERNGQNQNIGTPFEVSSFNHFFSFSAFVSMFWSYFLLCLCYNMFA